MNLLTFLMLIKTARTNSQPRLEATRGSRLCSKNKCLTIGLLLGLAVAAVVFAGFQFFDQNLHDSLHAALVLGIGMLWSVQMCWLTVRVK